jgi:hypothetical protein
MKHLMIPLFLPVRLPRRERGAGCTERPRRIRCPVNDTRHRPRLLSGERA